MASRKLLISLILAITLLFSTQAAFAGIKVSNADKPVYISSHMMGAEVIQQPNGVSSLGGIITGFAGNQFPLPTRFKTLTTFVATGRYDSPLSSFILTNDTGKETLARYDFTMFFARPGTMSTQIVDWKINFPKEGFYAFNVFVDGTLVGYYPFYVWTNGMIIK